MFSRFVRIFVLAVILVTVPAAFLFYPAKNADHIGGDAFAVDQGGIDSEHWREPVAPHAEGGFGQHVVIEDEEQRDAPPKEEPWVADQSEPGSEQVSGGSPPEEGNGDAHVPASGGEKPAHHEGDEDKPVSSGGGGTGGWLDAVADTHGKIIMPEMGNATAKAELGRGTWRLLHLITMRFPDKPTDDDRAALKTFFYMFARLYPCGECAKHFQAMLKKYPPQTASRQNASLWLCSLHNMVNERLKKPQFDCTKLDETWDCGCGNSTTSATSMAETGTVEG